MSNTVWRIFSAKGMNPPFRRQFVCLKNLADLGQSANLILEKCHQQGLMLAFLHEIRLKKDHKELKIDQKGQTRYQ